MMENYFCYNGVGYFALYVEAAAKEVDNAN